MWAVDLAFHSPILHPDHELMPAPISINSGDLRVYESTVQAKLPDGGFVELRFYCRGLLGPANPHHGVRFHIGPGNCKVSLQVAMLSNEQVQEINRFLQRAGSMYQNILWEIQKKFQVGLRCAKYLNVKAIFYAQLFGEGSAGVAVGHNSIFWCFISDKMLFVFFYDKDE